jgi:hypothetical protein
MPFDIRHLRNPILYDCSESTSKDDRTIQHSKLSKALETAFRAVLSSDEFTTRVFPVRSHQRDYLSWISEISLDYESSLDGLVKAINNLVEVGLRFIYTFIHQTPKIYTLVSNFEYFVYEGIVTIKVDDLGYPIILDELKALSGEFREAAVDFDNAVSAFLSKIDQDMHPAMKNHLDFTFEGWNFKKLEMAPDRTASRMMYACDAYLRSILVSCKTALEVQEVDPEFAIEHFDSSPSYRKIVPKLSLQEGHSGIKDQFLEIIGAMYGFTSPSPPIFRELSDQERKVALNNALDHFYSNQQPMEESSEFYQSPGDYEHDIVKGLLNSHEKYLENFVPARESENIGFGIIKKIYSFCEPEVANLRLRSMLERETKKESTLDANMDISQLHKKAINDFLLRRTYTQPLYHQQAKTLSIGALPIPDCDMSRETKIEQYEEKK